MFVWFFYVPVNICSVMSGWIFLGRFRCKQRIKCLAQVEVPPLRLEPATPWSQVKHSITVPPRFSHYPYIIIYWKSWPALNRKCWLIIALIMYISADEDPYQQNKEALPNHVSISTNIEDPNSHTYNLEALTNRGLNYFPNQQICRTWSAKN